MKKRRQLSPALFYILKDSGPTPSGYDQAFVAVAARRAFTSFLRGILKESKPGPRRSA